MDATVAGSQHDILKTWPLRRQGFASSGPPQLQNGTLTPRVCAPGDAENGYTRAPGNENGHVSLENASTQLKDVFDKMFADYATELASLDAKLQTLSLRCDGHDLAIEDMRKNHATHDQVNASAASGCEDLINHLRIEFQQRFAAEEMQLRMQFHQSFAAEDKAGKEQALEVQPDSPKAAPDSGTIADEKDIHFSLLS
jgi:hypothetical protein